MHIYTYILTHPCREGRHTWKLLPVTGKNSQREKLETDGDPAGRMIQQCRKVPNMAQSSHLIITSDSASWLSSLHLISHQLKGQPCDAPILSHMNPTWTLKIYCLDINLIGKIPYVCLNFPSHVLIEERMIWHPRGNKLLLHPSESHMASLEITLVPC